MRSGAPHLVPAVLALLLALLGYLFWDRLASWGGSLETTDTQIRRALAGEVRASVDDVYGFHAGGTVKLDRMRFEDIASSVFEGRATVVAMLSAEGRATWRDELARLSYIGREKFHMRPCRIALWCAEGDEFDRLRGVLAALFRHRDALDRGDVQGLEQLFASHYLDHGEDAPAVLKRLFTGGPNPPRVRVRAWQIRVERERAEVGEDLDLAAPGEPPRPERHLYHLVVEGGRWLFAGGV
ncbi:MAG TPA: nuclear transport factor 2 family protein [Anaeromyxobacteraceae bacterium]|nr:nuclear transport factor 2 family protein [Anaeromyxobacteraceae bacterium]